MIIDVHYHLMVKVNRMVVEMLVRDPIHAAKVMGKDISPEALIKRALETWGDPNGEHLIASMDEAGIDITCICMVDNASVQKFTPEMAQKGNAVIGEIARKYPDRVIGLAGVDPRRDNAPHMLKQCFEEFGLKGLKYHPDHGYDPTGSDSYRLLEVLEKNNGVLLTHTGPLGPPSRCKFADPLLLADLAVDFPNLKVIAAHMGSAANWRPWASLAGYQPNLYGDLAMWDKYAFGRYELFCRELRDLIDYAGISKVLFATDNPLTTIVEPTKNWIQLIKDLPDKAPEGIKFTKEEVDAILGGNAAALLNLDTAS